MTSIPASRRAAATTLAPRSWPSRPGLATRTRIGLIERTKLAGAARERQLVSLLPGDEEHLRRRPRQRLVGEAVERLLHHEPRVGEQLGESRGGIEAETVLPRPRPRAALPGRGDGENSRQRIEVALLRKQSVSSRPPIAGQKARHDAVTTAAVPDQPPTTLQNARELAHDAGVVGGMGKEPERCEQIHHRVEPSGPA